MTEPKQYIFRESKDPSVCCATCDHLGWFRGDDGCYSEYCLKNRIKIKFENVCDNFEENRGVKCQKE